MKSLKYVLVFLVCVINIANTAGFAYLYNKADENNTLSESAAVTTESAAINNSTELDTTDTPTESTVIDESTKSETLASPTENNENTTAASEAETDIASEDTTEKQTEINKEIDYSGIPELCYIENYATDARPQICYDSYNNRIYFKSGNYNISYYDLQSNETVTVLDTTESETYINGFTVNPYNGKLYVISGEGLYDVEVESIITSTYIYSSIYCATFISENELIYGKYKIYLDGSKKNEIGCLPWSNNNDIDYYAPFNYNGKSYYILHKFPWNSDIVKVPDIFTRTGNYSERTEIEPIFRKVFVFNDLIYYLGEDNKMYIYDVETGKSEPLFDDSVYSEVEISELAKIDDNKFAIFDLNTYSLRIIEK